MIAPSSNAVWMPHRKPKVLKPKGNDRVIDVDVVNPGVHFGPQVCSSGCEEKKPEKVTVCDVPMLMHDGV